MGELATTIAREISGEGSREFIQFTETTRQSYLIELQRLRSKLDQQYKIENYSERRKTLESRFDKEIYQKVKDVLDTHIKKSGRGTADLLFDGLSIKKVAEDTGLLDIFKQIRAETFALKENNDLLNISLQTMSIISNLRQDIYESEVEEHIGITFAAAGYQKLLTVPMSQFLKVAQNNSDLVSLHTLSLASSTFGDINALSMNMGTSVIDQLTRINGANVMNLQFKKSNIMQDLQYEPLEKNLSSLIDRRTLRIDPKYKVIRPGFLREAIVEAMFQGERTTYKQDNAPWYGESDTIYHRDHNPLNNQRENLIELSIKDFMGTSSPTLLRINSLYNIINITEKVLSSKLNSDQVQTFLQNKVFNATSDLDSNVVERWLEEEVASILSG